MLKNYKIAWAQSCSNLSGRFGSMFASNDLLLGQELFEPYPKWTTVDGPNDIGLILDDGGVSA